MLIKNVSALTVTLIDKIEANSHSRDLFLRVNFCFDILRVLITKKKKKAIDPTVE